MGRIMTLWRRAARRDANEATIFKLARAMGWLIWPTSKPVDAVGLYRGRWYVIEIKTTSGKLTQAQQDFSTAVACAHGELLIWRTNDDVLKDCGRLTGG